MAERTAQQHVEAESLLQKYQSLVRGGNERSEYLKSLKVSELQVLLTRYSPSVNFKNMLKIPLRELLEQHINDYALVPQPAAIISSTVPGSSMLPSISNKTERKSTKRKSADIEGATLSFPPVQKTTSSGRTTTKPSKFTDT